MQCRDFMRRPVECVAEEQSAASAARTMRASNIGFLPVCDAAGRVIGVVTDRDLALRIVAEGRDPETTRTGDVMTRELVSCRPTDDLSAASALMRRHHKSRVVVSDDAGKPVGIVSPGGRRAGRRTRRGPHTHGGGGPGSAGTRRPSVEHLTSQGEAAGGDTAMDMTLGQLVTELYDVFEKRYGGGELAALATQVMVTDLLSRAERHPTHRRAAPRNPPARAPHAGARGPGMTSRRSCPNDARSLAPL